MHGIGGDDAFLIFIAIFWGVMLGSAARYQPFDTAAAFFARHDRHRVLPRRVRARRRFWKSMLVLNGLPLVYLALGYACLGNAVRGIPALLGAAVMSLGIFGCPRVLHAIVANACSWPRYFTRQHWQREIARDRHPSEHRMRAHLLPGITFLVGYFALGALIAHL